MGQLTITSTTKVLLHPSGVSSMCQPRLYRPSASKSPCPLDSTTNLERKQIGDLPCGGPIASSPRALSPEIVEKNTMQRKYLEVKQGLSVTHEFVRYHRSWGWMNCLTKQKTLVARARRIQFLSQNFNVANTYRSTGSYVPAAETVRGFKETLTQWADHLPRCLPWCWIDRRCDCQKLKKMGLKKRQMSQMNVQIVLHRMDWFMIIAPHSNLSRQLMVN